MKVTYKNMTIVTIENTLTATIYYNGKRYTARASKEDQVITIWREDDTEIELGEYCRTSVTDIVVNNVFYHEDNMSVPDVIAECCMQFEGMIKKLEKLMAAVKFMISINK